MCPEQNRNSGQTRELLVSDFIENMKHCRFGKKLFLESLMLLNVETYQWQEFEEKEVLVTVIY